MSEINRRDLMGLSVAVGSVLAVGGAISAEAAVPEIDINASMHGIMGVSIPKQVSVIGNGGSGCWPALFAALCGVEELFLVDAADVSADDMGRTCFRPSDIGNSKSAALADVIKIFRPNVKCTTQKRYLEPTDVDIYVGTVLFDGVDYKPLNKVLPEEATKRGMKYVGGFYKGLALALQINT